MSIIDKPELIDKDQLEFVYDNAINALKYLIESRRIISGRCIILLSYIALIIASCFNQIIDEKFVSLWSFFFLLPIVYYILIFSFIVGSVSLSYTAIPYDPPNNLLDREILGKNVHDLKFHACISLQHRITSNEKKTEDMYKNFSLATNLTFLFIPKVALFLRSLFF